MKPQGTNREDGGEGPSPRQPSCPITVLTGHLPRNSPGGNLVPTWLEVAGARACVHVFACEVRVQCALAHTRGASMGLGAGNSHVVSSCA